MQNYKTMWELAEKNNNNLPKLMAWLFDDFVKTYKYNGESIDSLVVKNVCYFLTLNFLNRELGHPNPMVWRTWINTVLANTYLDADYFAVLDALRAADVKITKTEKGKTSSNQTKNENDNLVKKNDVTEKRTTATTGEVSGTTSDTETQDLTQSDTMNQSGTSNIERSDKQTGTDATATQYTGTDKVHTKNVLSNYPQSNMSAGSGEPWGGWKYASGANETETETTRENRGDNTARTVDLTNAGTERGTNENNGTSERRNTGTLKRSGTNSGNSSVNGNDSATRNTSESSDRMVDTTANETTDINKETVENRISPFEQYQQAVMIFNKYPSYYARLTAAFEKCFISMFVDNERDGWFDPAVDLTSGLTI